MAKGYWVAQVNIHDSSAYEKYRAANAEPLAAFGGRFLVRGGQQEIVEGEGRPRTVVVEFPSYKAARDCFHSAEYQSARKLRLPVSDATLIVVEGYGD